MLHKIAVHKIAVLHKITVLQVHKIAVLDLRLANADRNGGNILASRGPAGEWQLTPIDHGCILPETFEDMSFEWSFWRQVRPCTARGLSGAHGGRCGPATHEWSSWRQVRPRNMRPEWDTVAPESGCVESCCACAFSGQQYRQPERPKGPQRPKEKQNISAQSRVARRRVGL